MYIYHTSISVYMYVCLRMSSFVSICIWISFCRFALMDLATETTGMAWAARVVCDAGSDAVSLLRAAIDAGSGAPDAENSDLVSREVVPVVMCIQNNGARYRGTTCSHVYTENSDLVSREVVPVVMCIQNTCMLACMHTLTHQACIHARGHASLHAFLQTRSCLRRNTHRC